MQMTWNDQNLGAAIPFCHGWPQVQHLPASSSTLRLARDHLEPEARPPGGQAQWLPRSYLKSDFIHGWYIAINIPAIKIDLDRESNIPQQHCNIAVFQLRSSQWFFSREDLQSFQRFFRCRPASRAWPSQIQSPVAPADAGRFAQALSSPTGQPVDATNQCKEIEAPKILSAYRIPHSTNFWHAHTSRTSCKFLWCSIAVGISSPFKKHDQQ